MASDAPAHPEFPDIASPAEADEFLKRMSPDELTSQAGITVGGNPISYPQRASLTMQNNCWLINWQGPLNSKWDWVTVGCRVPDGKGNWNHLGKNIFLFAPQESYSGGLAWDTGWQWCVSYGSPHLTKLGWQDIREIGGSDPRAVYFVWVSTKLNPSPIEPDNGYYQPTFWPWS